MILSQTYPVLPFFFYFRRLLETICNPPELLLLFVSRNKHHALWQLLRRMEFSMQPNHQVMSWWYHLSLSFFSHAFLSLLYFSSLSFPLIQLFSILPLNFMFFLWCWIWGHRLWVSRVVLRFYTPPSAPVYPPRPRRLHYD